MREHEVPTHVQAEDRVVLWFTFPQIVAITAVCALAYGAYRYAPVGPSGLRIAIAVLFGLAGLAAVVGKIGGRRLPLVAADLLKYRLGARRYAGPASQLVRSEPPAPVQQDRSGPGPTRLTLGWIRGRGEREKDGVAGRHAPGHGGGEKRRRIWRLFLVAAPVAVLAVSFPQVAQADEHWRDEIDFELAEPVPGRRIFVEGLTVSGDRAAVTLRAATALDIRVRAFGGPEGSWLRFWGTAHLDEGESIDYSLPLHGPAPSFTVSWEDGTGQAGALTVKSDQVPYPLPETSGELCNVRLASLGWTPGRVSGVIEAKCVTRIEHPVELQMVAGHESVTGTTVMDAAVTGITGTVVAATGASTASVAFVPGGETGFSLDVPAREAIHAVTVDVRLTADLSIPIPPLVQLTHHPQRTERRTETVSVYRPGASDTASKTITVTHDDGTTTQHTVTAHAHVPGGTVRKDVTITIVHPEHVKAEVLDRDPIAAIRAESLSLSSGVGSDDPFAVLVLPEPEPEDPPGEQTPADDLRGWFDILGWEWPW